MSASRYSCNCYGLQSESVGWRLSNLQQNILRMFQLKERFLGKNQTLARSNERSLAQRDRTDSVASEWSGRAQQNKVFCIKIVAEERKSAKT